MIELLINVMISLYSTGFFRQNFLLILRCLNEAVLFFSLKIQQFSIYLQTGPSEDV